MSSTSHPSRLYGLDTLRALAIVLVFMNHYLLFVSEGGAFGFWGEIGWVGVDLFFALSGYLIGNQAAGQNPLPPKAELQWWYQFYFATERGRVGYEKNTHDFAKLIWQLASPQWKFDDATFDRSAEALQNPDHVEITVFNYRWRLGLVQGEAKYAALEEKLSTAPSISVPTITLEGDANGAPHPAPEDYAKRFTGKYQFRLIEGGIGHNLPQEAPKAFAQAVVDADHL